MDRPWIRLYTDLPANPKAQRLPPPLFKFWINCLCLYGKRGFLPSNDDLAWALKMTSTKVQESILALSSAGLLDGETENVTPHDWDELQFESDTSRERQKKYRERHKKRNSDVTVTAQETEQIQSRADTEQRQRRARENSHGNLAERYQDFLAQFPYPTGADEGCRQWISMIHVGEISESNVDQIFQGLARWKASRQWANGKRQTIPNWLRDKRWQDNPEPQAKDALDD